MQSCRNRGLALRLPKAQRRSSEYQQRTILFIDEVHRWNKAQQDALLPWVEWNRDSDRSHHGESLFHGQPRFG